MKERMTGRAARGVFRLAQAALRAHRLRFFGVEQLGGSGVEQNGRSVVEAANLAAEFEAVLVGQVDV